MQNNIKRTLTSSSTVPSEFSVTEPNTENSSFEYLPVCEPLYPCTLSRSHFVTFGSSKEDSIEAEADARLMNWDRWLTLHKREMDNLEGKLNRPPQCMLMSKTLDKLHVNQEKECITEASNFVSSDRQRGHPNFWETDDNLKSGGKSLGTYHTIQEKYDRSRDKYDKTPYYKSANAGFTGVADAIRKEMGLFGKPCAPSPKTKWEDSEYVVNKKEELKDQLSVIQEHVPDCSDLVVVGTRPEPSKLSGPTFFSIESEPQSEVSNEYHILGGNFKREESGQFTIEIGSRSIDAASKSWTVTFKDCLVNEKYKDYIRIYNLANASLRYYWEIVLPSWVECELPLTRVKKARQCFYFNKNNGVIMPSSENIFWFHLESSAAGVFCEKWKFVLSQAPNQYRYIDVELQAVVAEPPDCRRSIEKIESYIEACTRYTIARKTTEEILKRSTSRIHEELPYNWKFFEEQIFTHNNPDLYYDNKFVLQLKNLYEKIAVGPWDYSVDSLRKALFQKSSAEDMSKAIENYISTIYELMKPNVSSFLSAQKHKTVYELLCGFANKMESESINLKRTYKRALALKYLDEVGLDKLTSKFSATSAKLSKSSQNAVEKKSSTKVKSIAKESSAVTMDVLSSLLQLPTADVSLDTVYGSAYDRITQKQEYLDALYVKTYHHLSQTINHISDAIDSFDAQRKRTAIKALKDRVV